MLLIDRNLHRLPFISIQHDMVDNPRLIAACIEVVTAELVHVPVVYGSELYAIPNIVPGEHNGD